MFHLIIGDMIVTLQDVAIILGLHIHRPLIIDTCHIDWSLLCSELLGVISSSFQISFGYISMMVA